MTDTFPGSKVRHGTTSGWKRHQELGERPCDPCFRAKSAYDANRLQSSVPKQKNLDHARAQSRAKTRLAQMYPALYAEMYAEEKAIIAKASREDDGSALHEGSVVVESE